jgi:transcription-repair coupling factor (superfamily II helicase)
MNQRLSAYRRMASARALDEVDALVEELRDRYGPPTLSIRNLAEYARIRLLADRIGLEAVDREGTTVVLRFRQDAKLDPAWLMKQIQSRTDLTLLPPAILRLDLQKPEPKRPPAAPDEEDLSESWWTARATTGTVSPGFRRDAILAEEAIDPASEGGLFDRVGALLRLLAGAVG